MGSTAIFCFHCNSSLVYYICKRCVTVTSETSTQFCSIQPPLPLLGIYAYFQYYSIQLLRIKYIKRNSMERKQVFIHNTYYYIIYVCMCTSNVQLFPIWFKYEIVCTIAFDNSSGLLPSILSRWQFNQFARCTAHQHGKMNVDINHLVVLASQSTTEISRAEKKMKYAHIIIIVIIIIRVQKMMKWGA